MRFKLSPALALCAAAALAAAAPRAQDGQGGQQVIDDFVTTRGVTFESPGARKPAQPQPPRPQQQAASRPTQQAASRPAGKGGPAPARNPGGQAPAAATKKGGPGAQGSKRQTGSGDLGTTVGGAEPGQAAVLQASAGGVPDKPIGIGFTLFMKQGDNLVAADPTREFRQGDRLRIALETNTDGYLYIFHTENGRNPQMIYPNPAVDGGQNFVGAHARDFYPTDLSAWFEFDEVPASERLYFVVTRSPLAGVPTGRELAAACGGSNADCLWKPSPQQWERITAGQPGRKVVEGRNPQLASLSAPPPGAMTRGIKVKKEEPAPALVRVNDSAESDVLVTTIDLIHK